jgi:hypothetical protein
MTPSQQHRQAERTHITTTLECGSAVIRPWQSIVASPYTVAHTRAPTNRRTGRAVTATAASPVDLASLGGYAIWNATDTLGSVAPDFDLARRFDYVYFAGCSIIFHRRHGRRCFGRCADSDGRG